MNTVLRRTLAPVLALLCTFATTLTTKAQHSPYMPPLKTVLTYNIRNATTDDGEVDFADVVRTIHQTDADFIALQELDSAIEDIKVIGYITKPELGKALISRDGNEFELKAQGWNHMTEE